VRPINRSILLATGGAFTGAGCGLASFVGHSPAFPWLVAACGLASAFACVAAARRQQRAFALKTRELEIALELARAERQAADGELARMKNEFTSMVSHELRTPLASIKAYVEMLIDGEAPDDSTQREFYEVIQNEANRLGRLIDNVLNISRIEAGLVRVRREPVDPADVVREAVDTIAPHARQKRIALGVHLPDESCETLADRDMLYQAAVNLLSNAVKYTPEGGAVSVDVAADEDRRKVLIRIIDTGVGIPPKDLPFVFDKFYRAEANNRIAPGTGLGLSLVRHIVETVHGGRVWAESQVGKGSTFAAELDLVTSDSLLCC
jgi:two-component system phosphate regulon sensor histidine kinase PhoR